MPTESCNLGSTPESSLTDDLVNDLESVVKLVRTELASQGADKDALALVHVLSGVSPTAWEHFSAAHGLENWLGISLGENLADSMTRLLSVQERLAYQRDHDALTGIGNRAYFNRCLALEVERALRSRAELSLIYIDLDHFKRINDSYGHPCGDTVLHRLGSILRHSMRHYDIAARVGGEEFAVLLPSTSCWTGIMLGNRILDAFRRETFTCGEQSFSMTFSGGVSSLAMLDEEHKNGRELVKSADKALYEAKAEGRNSIALALSEKISRDRASLVHAQEKQFLFSSLDSEYDS